MRQAIFRLRCIVVLSICFFRFQSFATAAQPQVVHYQKQFEWTASDGAISALAWRPDNQLLAAASLKGQLQIWNADLNIVNTMQTDIGSISSLDWRPDGSSTLAVGSYDGTIRLWDAQEGRQSCIFMGHGRTLSPSEGKPNGVAVVKWSPDGKKLASGDNDGNVRLWDTTTDTPCSLLQPLVIPPQNSSAVWLVDWNAAGDALLSVGVLNSVPIWDAKTGQKHDEITCPIPRSEKYACNFQSADWSPDGQYIMATGENGVVSFAKIWNVATKESRDLIGMCTNFFNWMPKSHALMGWCDGQIQMFDADTLQRIATTDFPQGYWERHQYHFISAYAISPDEQHIAISYHNGAATTTIQIWGASPSGNS